MRKSVDGQTDGKVDRMGDAH